MTTNGSGPGAGFGIIDVNAQMGPRHGQAAGATLEELGRERRGHGVRSSLTRHRNAIWAEASSGNEEIIEAAQSDPGIIPVAALSVDRTDRYLERPAAFASRVAAFWIEGVFEGRGSPIDSVPSENLLQAIARTGKPLFIVLRGAGHASQIGRATAGLGIPVILVGHHYDYSVENIAAAKRYEHLHLETSRMAHLDAVTVAVNELGAERVLYGTGAPIRAMQSALNAILQAQISDDAKRLVLGGNAQRLFGLPVEPVRLPTVSLPPRSIDVHTHFGPFPWDVPNIEDEALLPLLRERNNSVGAVESCVLAIAADLDAGNQRTVDLCRELSAEGQVGYLVADPTDRERAREHIRRWGDAPGIVGAKVHCQWSHRLTGHPQIGALFEVLADWGKPVKIHNDGDDWHERLLEIARRHPRLPIVIAHGGLGYPMLEGAQLTVEAENVYFEMCSSFAQPLSAVREIVRTIPRHKFLFGTDAPLLDPGFVLGTYQDSEIPEDQQDDVYYGNAVRLYGLPEANTRAGAGAATPEVLA
jgi:predicted TIM-barrel fold metal-dependent hydrolase